MDDRHPGDCEGERDAGGQGEREPAAGNHHRLAHHRRSPRAQAQGGTLVRGGVRRRRGRHQPQPAMAAELHAGERGDGGRIDREDGRPAAPHPLSRASAIRYAMRLWREKSSMKPGAAACENEVSALKVARLRS